MIELIQSFFYTEFNPEFDALFANHINIYFEGRVRQK
jgi:hypothetical protein